MDINELAEKVALDERFQAACQRYAHANGSSSAIAMAALKAVRCESSEDVRAALAKATGAA